MDSKFEKSVPDKFDPEQWSKITQNDPFQTYVVQTLSAIEDSIEKINEDIKEIKQRMDIDD